MSSSIPSVCCCLISSYPWDEVLSSPKGGRRSRRPVYQTPPHHRGKNKVRSSSSVGGNFLDRVMAAAHASLCQSYIPLADTSAPNVIRGKDATASSTLVSISIYSNLMGRTYLARPQKLRFDQQLSQGLQRASGNERLRVSGNHLRRKNSAKEISFSPGGPSVSIQFTTSMHSNHQRKSRQLSLAVAPLTFLEKLPGPSRSPEKVASGLTSLKNVALLQDSLGTLSRSMASVVQKATEFSNVPTPSPSLQLLRQSSSSLWQAAATVTKSASVGQLSHSASMVLHNAQALTSEIGSRVAHLASGSLEFHTPSLSTSAEHLASQIGTTVGGYYEGLGIEAAPMTTTAVLATIATSSVVVSSLHFTENKKAVVEGKDLPLRYNPDAIASYFKTRPIDIIIRSVKIMFECCTLTANILIDKYVGREQDNQRLRATQLVELVARLGPTAIKIGQALSIRPDILPVVYLEELQKLQDRVPPFSNTEAKQLILEGLGKDAEEIFSEISVEPVAAASLGQVYKARLQETGDIVAVKVQRPGVLEGVSRDLYLLRTGARLLQALPFMQTDFVGLLDTWALRFFDELDYVQEGKNAIRFSKDMRFLPNVTVPDVYPSHTSRKVLTTAWVNGEKLSESNAADLLPLITTALNCYLIQLLESGFLHADPHPGNLLRTTDGRLCVLDFGLMTEVTEDQRYTLMEYVSHLVNSDYARVAEDLVKLGFVPAEFVDPEKTAAVVPQISRVLGQIVQGGGVQKVNIQQVTDDLIKISKDYVFVIPPYFALILRAFSVLEGIGLDADPDYTIVHECYPYISKRLLTDDSPRTRVALQYFLYGGKTQLDIQRVEDITAGFQNFRELMVPTNGEAGQPPKLKPIDPWTKEALLLLFAPEGSFVQELLLTELVRAVDALSREALAELWHYFATTIRIPLPASLVAPGSWPLPLPGLVMGLNPVAKLSEEDQKSLKTVRRLWILIEPQLNRQSSFAEIVEVAEDIMPLLWDLVPGVTTAAQRFAVMLLQRQALRFADDLDGKKSLLEWDKDPTAFARQIRPFPLAFSKQRLASGSLST